MYKSKSNFLKFHLNNNLKLFFAKNPDKKIRLLFIKTDKLILQTFLKSLKV